MSFLDLVTLRAFRPHPKNLRIPIAQRMPGERVLVLGVGAGQIRAALARVPLHHGDKVILEYGQMFQKRESLSFSDFMGALRKKDEFSKARYAILVLQYSWKAYLRNGYFDKNELNARLRSNADAVISETGALVEGTGEVYEHDSVYAGLAHPTTDRVLLFSANAPEVGILHDQIEEHDLSIVGVKISALSALERFYESTRTQAEDVDVAYLDRFAYCFVESTAQQQGEGSTWAEVRFASRRSEEVMERFADAVRERNRPERPIILLSDEQRCEEVRRMFPSLEIKAAFPGENFDVLSSSVS